jgi:hypothetical protein
MRHRQLAQLSSVRLPHRCAPVPSHVQWLRRLHKARNVEADTNALPFKQDSLIAPLNEHAKERHLSSVDLMGRPGHVTRRALRCRAAPCYRLFDHEPSLPRPSNTGISLRSSEVDQASSASSPCWAASLQLSPTDAEPAALARTRDPQVSSGLPPHEPLPATRATHECEGYRLADQSRDGNSGDRRHHTGRPTKDSCNDREHNQNAS